MSGPVSRAQTRSGISKRNIKTHIQICITFEPKITYDEALELNLSIHPVQRVSNE